MKWEKNTSSSLFNSVIVAYAIVVADEIGLLESLNSNKTIDLIDFCSKNKIQEYPFRIFCDALSTFEILSISRNNISKGNNFIEIFSNKGYFIWLLKGYSYTLENMGLLLRAKTLQVSNVKRRGDFIAKSGKDYGKNFVDSYFNETFKKVNPKSVVDFGCGSADRLISIVKNNNDIKCIGIDINLDAVEVARQNVKNAGLENNIEIICADVNTLTYDQRFNNIDTMFCFFMGHDLWPKENCFNIFSNFNKVFPNAINFLLCDTYRSEENQLNKPIFTLGFELTHAFMGQLIPTYSDWTKLFGDLNWKLLENIDVGIPYSTIFKLRIK